LIRHPSAGNQLPAGTVEPGETPEDAAAREVFEETGLSGLSLVAALGVMDDMPPAGHAVIAAPTPVYARHDAGSFDWAWLRRGLGVQVLRHAPGFVQVSYVEWDRLPNPDYVSYAITGWVPSTAVTATRRRYFFLFDCAETTPPTWTVATDHHQFTLFWTPLAALPRLISPQDSWLAWLPSALA
jgi:8-oxo-dGTP pyrophosphatase MutT (NUDIX family)